MSIDTQVPTVFGKTEKQDKLIASLDREFVACARCVFSSVVFRDPTTTQTQTCHTRQLTHIRT